MSERPIIFSTDMVRAILDGRKTQTRRVLKLKDGYCHPYYSNDNQEFLCYQKDPYGDMWGGHKLRCPYGKPGDILYVRETWRKHLRGEAYFQFRADNKMFVYSEFGGIAEVPQIGGYETQKWKSSYYMPKKASRIWLKVKDIRVERVQDISEEDAISEGIDMESEHASLCINIEGAGYSNDLPKGSAILAVFKKLWNSINGKRGYGWDKNPWLWVVDFEVISTTGKPEEK